jgi:hypothetical protein
MARGERIEMTCFRERETILSYQKRKEEGINALLGEIIKARAGLAAIQEKLNDSAEKPKIGDYIFKTTRLTTFRFWQAEAKRLSREIKQKEAMIEQLGLEAEMFTETICIQAIAGYEPLFQIDNLAGRIVGICRYAFNAANGRPEKNSVHRISGCFANIRNDLAKLEALCALQEIPFTSPGIFELKAYPSGCIERTQGVRMIGDIADVVQHLQNICIAKKDAMQKAFLANEAE